MLAQTLDVLERDGLVARTGHPVVPPRVEYALTESGRALAERFIDLFRWIGTNVETFTSAQRRYDSRRTPRDTVIRPGIVRWLPIRLRWQVMRDLLPPPPLFLSSTAPIGRGAERAHANCASWPATRRSAVVQRAETYARWPS